MFKVGDKVTYQESKKIRGNAVISAISVAKKHSVYIETETGSTLLVPMSELELFEDPVD